jgi:chromosome segregation protein
MISRLKSLELQGYKTFANRTVFQFPGAVTAIVGPNGSGKSNISDALRWVLGEQSYSLLRGKKTEDMIFAGSERRTRSGMATATVILDNSDNWLPIDYSEVAVTRRAYRDGSNEYLLNGQRVRLRDVSELLAESGLAERTYTIIGQGLVDAALALRAEDRRRLFEEAAGIGLYRSRREEAVRRLKNTHRNLERVNDILAELRPRLKSLEKQAHRAKDHDRAVSNLRSLLKEWYGYHWHQSQNDLSQAQNILREQEGLLADIRQRAAGFEEEIGALRAERQGLRSDLNGNRHRSSDLHSKLETASRELAIAEERSNNLIAQESKTKTDIVRAEEELDLLEARFNFASQEVDRKNVEFHEANERYDQVRETKDRRAQERGSIETRLNHARELLVKVSTQRSEIFARLTERQAQLKHFEKSFTRSNDDLEVKKKELKIAQTKAEDSAQKTEDLSTKVEELKFEKEEVRQKSLAQRNEIELLDKQLAKKQTESAKLSAELHVLEQAKRTYAGYSEGAKVLLQAGQSDKINRSLGVLAGKIQVPEKFEIAIGAVLGDFLEAIILGDKSEIEKALSLLESESQKAAILPLEVLNSSDNNFKILDNDGLIGPALEFVSTSEEFKPAIELLLRNTYIVENRQFANNILDHYRRGAEHSISIEFRVVTLKGEVFHLRGPITTSAASSPVSLSRRREEKENKDKQENVAHEIQEIEEAKELIEERISSLNIEGQKLESLLLQQEKSLEDEKTLHNQSLIKLEQLRRELDWQEEKISEISVGIDGVNKQIDDLTNKSTEIESQVSDLEERINKGVAELIQLPMDELESDLAHWTTRVAVLEQSVSEASIRREERKASLESARENVGILKSGVESLAKDRNELDEKINLYQSGIKQTSEQIESIRLLILPAEEKLEIIEQKIADLLSHESQERLISSQAEQNYTQAKIAQVRRKEALDALRKRIEVDFGLVSYEYLDDVSGPNPLPFDDLVEELPIIAELSIETEKELNRQRSHLRRIGPINPESQQEYKEVVERFEYLTNQVDDLQDATADINQVIKELDEIMEREFCSTFEEVAEEFHQIFSRLFGGGSARLVLTDPEELTDTGIDIEARLPGRREQGLSLLSGGERSLTAVALVFALLRVSPTPFCVLDEVDAMLDEANVGRFRELLRELSETTQFVMITHNRATVQVADIIYGVTMGKDSTSQILSLKVDEIEKVV